jgi:N-acetylmuramoyl-L-alanine amidase
VHKLIVLGIIVVLGIACGCQGPGDHASETIPGPVPVPPMVVTPPSPEPTNTPPIVPAPQAPDSRPPTQDLLSLTPWVPWESWCRAQGLARPVISSRTLPRTAELSTPAGRLDLYSGSRLAAWNGATFWLGFAPLWQTQQLQIHNLDIRKSLVPLVQSGRPRLGKNAVIVLDPGHGGRSPGAKSVLDNRYEKEFTLDWALRAQRALAGNGWKVHLTRTNDTEVSIIERIALADLWHADLFISLHFNSTYPMNDPSGIETYCLTPSGMPSSYNRDFDDSPDQVFPNNAYDAENLQFALWLHHACLEATTAKDRSVHRSRFLGVLRNQTRPAILIEGGFLSNPTEARRIADPAYRQLLGAALARAIQKLDIPEANGIQSGRDVSTVKTNL